MGAVLTLNKVTKYYGSSKTAAVKELSLSVKAGEVYGFLGSNGAGKSTTIRMILDFLRPSAGTITILGKDSVTDSVAAKHQVGYLAGDVALYRGVNGVQLLAYLGALQGSYDKAYTQELAKRFEVELQKPLETLSKGNRQKIGILQAFMHQPALLVLDEPTSGLDPVMQERFYETVQEAKARGAAVFLSSHSLAEVQRMCDRVGIIRKGVLVREGALRDFGSTHVTLQVFFKDAVPVELEKSKAVEVIQRTGSVAIVRPKTSVAQLLAALSKYDIVDVQNRSQELEDAFMSYYEEKQA